MIDKIKRAGRDYLNDVPYIGNIGKLGAYGGVIFRVGENNTVTPKDFSVSSGNEIITHTRILKPPITEFSYRKLKSVNFDIKLFHTFAPIKKTIKEFERISERGEHHPLIIGNIKISNHEFILRSFSYKITSADGAGTPLIAELTLLLEEYITSIDNEVTDKYLDERGTEILKEKTVHNVNSSIIASLQGGRLW